MFITINNEDLKKLESESKYSPRKRLNYNFHKNPDDLLQRMLHILNAGTYIQPHKHEDPDKREVFIVLKGKVAAVEYNDYGQVINHFILDHSKGNFGIEIPEKTWHSLIALEDNCVLYEVKDGPYSPEDDKHFAPWAPKENEPGCREYLQTTLKKIGY
ncbi:MAG: WbuC family cupin fold metalloprotein [Bacteroidales bacterium]|nr:WbuC family cupin fold metalloprotein [Bacteroidales bacterium]